MLPKRKHYVSTSHIAGHIVITFKITTLWIFWTNDRKIMDTFKMGLHCLQLVTTDKYIKIRTVDGLVAFRTSQLDTLKK